MLAKLLIPLLMSISADSFVQKSVKDQHNNDVECPGKEVDIVFVLDVTIDADQKNKVIRHFNRRLDYVKAIVSQFDIGPNQTQASLVTFSSYPQQEFSFADHHNRPHVVNAINRVSTRKGFVNTADAIRFVRVASFFRDNGARKGIPKVAVILTTGPSRSVANTIREAKLTRDFNVHIFAIGLDVKVSKHELDGIVAHTSQRFHVNMNSFRSIRKSIQKLKRGICEVKPLLAERRERLSETVKPEKGCGGVPADIVFLLDASSSIWPVNFRKQLTFVQDIVHVFDIAPNRTRVGVVTFDNKPHIEFHLNTFNAEKDIISSIGEVKQSTGGTNIGDALRFVREEVFSERHSNRSDAARVIILITDGRSYYQQHTALEAARTHAAGIYVFSIGVGSSVDLDELRAVATDPDDKYVFTMDNYDSLESIKVVLAIETCKVKTEPDTLTLRNIAQIGEGCEAAGSADIVFAQALSSISGSVETRNFLKDLASEFDIDGGKFRIGMAKSPCQPDEGFSLNAFTNSNEVIKHFDQPNKKRKGPKVARALRAMRVRNFRLSDGARINVKRIGVILIEGKPEDIKLASKEAEKARRMGDIELFVIGIGDEFNDEDLEALASKPSHQHVYRVKDFLGLHKMKKHIRDMLCAS